jgi:transposase
VHRTFDDRKVQRVRDLACGGWRIYLDLEIRRVACTRCGLVKQERLAWLAETPGYTKRLAFAVGRRCRAASIQDVAQEFRLDWRTVKGLEMQNMRVQLRRAGIPSYVASEYSWRSRRLGAGMVHRAGGARPRWAAR